MLTRRNMAAATLAALFVACGGEGSTPGLTEPPNSLAYATNPATYTVGTAITPNTPSSGGGAVASYAVPMAYRIRFCLQMNAREAMHLLELRTSPQGHPAYRVVGQEMHRLIAEQAGHRAIAAAMRHVDHQDHDLERLVAERAAETRRLSTTPRQKFAGP